MVTLKSAMLLSIWYVILKENYVNSMCLSGVQMYGGMRGIKGLVTETSVLDPEEVM